MGTNAENLADAENLPDGVGIDLPDPRAWQVVSSLCQREIVRFLRQPSRMVGAIGQPILFWLFFSAGFDRTFRIEQAGGDVAASFRDYYFPGTLMLILLFTAIFSTISVIEDRREGFLQSVLVAPIPRWSMVLGKVLGGSLLALIQGWLFLLLGLTMDIPWSVVGLLQLSALMLVSAIGLTSLGMVIAWRMQSTQGFHAVMTLFLMPLWLLSGAFFPVPDMNAASSWGQVTLHWLMKCNPLTYTVGGLHRLIFAGTLSDGLLVPSLPAAWGVTSLFAVVMLLAAWHVAGTRTTGDLA